MSNVQIQLGKVLLLVAASSSVRIMNVGTTTAEARMPASILTTDRLPK